jgi:hypothetical protein
MCCGLLFEKALQTADRISLNLQPTLNLVTESLSTVNRQLETVCSQAEHQRNTQDNQGLILAKVEKDAQSLVIQARSLESRLDSVKKEQLQAIETLQNVRGIVIPLRCEHENKTLIQILSFSSRNSLP